MNYLGIVNPNAGRGINKEKIAEISNLLLKYNISVEMQVTNGAGHAETIAKNFNNRRYSGILVIGGDGTLNEIVNGLFLNDVDFQNSALGMIPIGTGNDWRRTFGISEDSNKAVSQIVERNIKKQDIGIVKFTKKSTEQIRYFANVLGIGYDSEVANKVNLMKKVRKPGKLAYIQAMISELIRFQMPEAEIVFNSNILNGKYFSMCVGIGRFNGGGIKQLPDADPFDGKLDVTLIDDIPKADVIRYLPKLYNGKFISHPKVRTFLTDSIHISCKEGTYIEADGEILGKTPVDIGILPSALNVITGI